MTEETGKHINELPSPQKRSVIRSFLQGAGKTLKWLFSRHGMEAFAGLLIVIFAALWTIGVIDRDVMPIIVTSGVELKIPDLIDLPVRSAELKCTESGIELIRKRVRIDNNFPPGTVIDQFPIPGAVVKRGRRVEVILSAREQLLLCPEVTGKSPREAVLIADSAGIVINELVTNYRHSDEVPEGVVIRQYPSSMTGMSRGDTLSISVSLGPEPKSITAPELTGRKFEEMDFILAKHLLRLGKITRYPDKTSSPGTILSQSPPAGTPLQRGDKIDIRIAIKPSKPDTH